MTAAAQHDLWSTTDYVYMCLRDRMRTEAFRDAIRRTVRPGDTVVDVGAGTGILSLFAAGAGAGHVYSVEQDAHLCRRLERTIARNGLSDTVTVVHGDAREVDLPPAVDVVVAELVETGLVDESQVACYNHLLGAGVVGDRTRVLPAGYATFGQLAWTDTRFYGYEIDVVRHEWPFYGDPGHWVPTAVEPRSSRFEVWSGTFDGSPIEPCVSCSARLPVGGEGANALVLSGSVRLGAGVVLGACPAMNGDKVVVLDEPVPPGTVDVTLSYRMSEGLGQLRVDATPSSPGP